ncbi:amino acid permease [Arthrobacter sp. zg-Y238]|uniref:amino acid permease n=1 Tax=Arthrobacter sp. zg-Y238 TaxID=2964614 RepID=UPI0021039F2D|nr:amino acid permease [Arthrobacter sp. zg-Y238]MCQ1953491.1 amino acid permease [Arthrobacter sp. zg-Y238]
MSDSKAANPSGSDRRRAKSKQNAQITIGALAVMNIVAVVSLRGLPSEAEYGLSSIFYYVLAAVVFLIPVSIVAAELATGWPETGGVFRWVGEAFGPRWAFLAMFMLFIEVTIWFPTVLTSARFHSPTPGTARAWMRSWQEINSLSSRWSWWSTGWPRSLLSAARRPSPG